MSAKAPAVGIQSQAQGSLLCLPPSVAACSHQGHSWAPGTAIFACTSPSEAGLAFSAHPACDDAACLPPSHTGGSLQIIMAMVAGGAISAWMCDSPVAPGVFTGALLAMSSTSVVVKCLEATR